MPTARESLLAALHARLLALPATALRGEVLPERVPAEGLLILRDGEPGEPVVTLSPLCYHYQHRAEIEAVVQGSRYAFSLTSSPNGFAMQTRRHPSNSRKRTLVSDRVCAILSYQLCMDKVGSTTDGHDASR